MIIGKRDIQQYFDKCSKNLFKIYKAGTTNSGNPVYSNSGFDETTTDVDFESAKADFMDILELLKHGDYTLILDNYKKDGVKNGKGQSRIDFRIPVNEALEIGAKNVMEHIGSTGVFDYETMLTKAKEMAKDEFEKLETRRLLACAEKDRDEAKKEARDYEKKLQDPFNKFIGAISPHITSIVAGITGKPGALVPLRVSGVQPDQTLEDNGYQAHQESSEDHTDIIPQDMNELSDAEIQHRTEVIENFVMAISAKRPNDWLKIVEDLTRIIRDKPEKFAMALNFL